MAEQEKVVRIFKDGDIIKEYNIKDIDYIEVHDYIPAPEGMNATTENNAINLQWNAVNNAVYNVYRSGDNVNFTLIAQNLTENKYTDNFPLSGSNYYKIKAIVNGTESGFSTSVIAAIADSGLASGIYLGVFGFNQALYNQPITQLETSCYKGIRLIQSTHQYFILTSVLTEQSVSGIFIVSVLLSATYSHSDDLSDLPFIFTDFGLAAFNTLSVQERLSTRPEEFP